MTQAEYDALLRKVFVTEDRQPTAAESVLIGDFVSRACQDLARTAYEVRAAVEAAWEGRRLPPDRKPD